MKSTYVFGGDVGRTKVSLCLVSEHALTLGLKTEGLGKDLAVQLERLGRALLEEHRVDGVRLSVLGVAGCWTDEEKGEYEGLLQRTGVLGKVRVLSDAEVALFGALSGRPGIVVISGTGSIAVGRDLEGGFARAGGYGHVLGDEGSGFWIGREAVLAGVRALEGRGPTTGLTRLIEGHDVRSEVRELLADAPGRLAGLAPQVIDIAREGDPEALRIVRGAAEHLAELCFSVSRRLKLGERKEVRTSGGVFRNRFIYRLFEEEVSKKIQGATVAPCERPPAYGAALVALEELGLVSFGHIM